MKTITIHSEKGKKEIDMPRFFSEPVREDLIFKYLETTRKKQPYGNSPVAGKQHSASGIIQHRRHVWKSGYGIGISRVPRKIVSVRGTRFNWIGAEVSGVVGGRRAHPPKSSSFNVFFGGKLNKKESKTALISALSATADSKYLKKKYETLNDKEIKNIPFVIEDSAIKGKTKKILNELQKVLSETYSLAMPKKTVRAGKGKLRGRKYKTTAGMLIVIAKNEKLKLNGIDIKNSKNVSVNDLAKGGPGRITIYTESALKELNDRIYGVAKWNQS